MALNPANLIKAIPANVTIGSYDSIIGSLYCISTYAWENPLQDPTQVPQCYGICPNPNIAGTGIKRGIFIQAAELREWTHFTTVTYRLIDKNGSHSHTGNDDTLKGK